MNTEIAGIKGLAKLVSLSLLVCATPGFCAAAKDKIVVMLGDSTTLCTYNKDGTKLTDYVQADLTQTRHLPVTIINSGKGADSAQGGLARLQEAVLAHNPDVVTISFGLNDTGITTPPEYRDSLDKIIRAIQQKTHARILLVTSTPFINARHAWGKTFAAKGGLDETLDGKFLKQMRELAQKYSLPVCDLHADFAAKFKAKPSLIDTLIMPDGVHLTGAGNQAAAESLAPMIAKLLAAPSAGPTR